VSALSDLRKLLPDGYTVEHGTGNGVYLLDPEGRRVKRPDGRPLLIATSGGDVSSRTLSLLLRKAGVIQGGGLGDG